MIFHLRGRMEIFLIVSIRKKVKNCARSFVAFDSAEHRKAQRDRITCDSKFIYTSLNPYYSRTRSPEEMAEQFRIWTAER